MAVRSENEKVIKRVYHSIKELVINYEIPPGERLKIELIAEQLKVSTTPVRESLNRLVAEDLILMVPGIGFFMKSLVESEIRDLYELNHVLLNWAVDNIARNRKKPVVVDFPELARLQDKLMTCDAISHEYLVKSSGKFFGHLARKSGNIQIDMSIKSINDKLYYLRICECELFEDPVRQVLPLFQLYCDCQYEKLSEALRKYHEERLRLLPEIIRLKNDSFRAVLEGN